MRDYGTVKKSKKNVKPRKFKTSYHSRADFVPSMGPGSRV